MYDLLIVDDESFVREGIQRTYDWGSYGFHVIDVADNGRAALEIVGRKRPHVVLTDIVMPEMDGLEFSEQVHRLYPGVNVVLLSAHKDFQYARKAIQFGVKGYLVKPIDETELSQLFSSLCHHLDHGTNPQSVDHGESAAPPPAADSSNSQYIRIAKQFVQEHMEKKIYLEDMGNLLHITPGHFRAVFKKETGINFIDYVIEAKMSQAKTLLLNSGYKVKDISLSVGYEDYTYFCRTFKKAVGCTPLEYRSMN